MNSDNEYNKIFLIYRAFYVFIICLFRGDKSRKY